MMVVVGVSDCRVSNNPDDVLVTYALGSCVAVAIHDPVSHVGGLLHFMLPESSIDRAKAEKAPFMFADTAIPRLFRSAYDRGAEKRRLVVRLVGGAQVVNDNGVFDIGKRNYLAARRILWKAGVFVQGEEVGGTSPRTIRLEVGSGKVWLRSDSREEEMKAEPATKGGRNWHSVC